MKRGLNMSWVLLPAVTALGAVVVGLPAAQSLHSARLNGAGWAMLLAIPLCGLSAAFRIPVLVLRQRLRRSKPEAIVESSTRAGALSNDLARLNDLDGGQRDSTWGALCLVLDESGLSAWRWNDRENPDWAFPWTALSEPVVGSIRNTGIGSSWAYRGLTLSVETDGRRSDLHLVLLGAGVFGIFALSTSRLREIAAACADWRDSQIAGRPTQ
jgi:hypothetical protein